MFDGLHSDDHIYIYRYHHYHISETFLMIAHSITNDMFHDVVSSINWTLWLLKYCISLDLGLLDIKIAVTCAMFSVLSAFGRMYFLAHHLLDVFIGSIIGGLVSMIINEVFLRFVTSDCLIFFKLRNY